MFRVKISCRTLLSSSYFSLCARRVHARFLRVLGRGKRMDSVCLIARFYSRPKYDKSLIISTLETEQRAFHNPQFAYISVTFLFTSDTHFQDRHTHFYGTFAFSDVFLTKARRLLLSVQPVQHLFLYSY